MNERGFHPRTVRLEAFQWKGDEPNKTWPEWLMQAVEEDRKAGDEGKWPRPTVSITNQNMPSVTLIISYPGRRSLAWALPGDWIVLLPGGAIISYDPETFRKLCRSEYLCPQCDKPFDPTRGIGPYGVAGTENGVRYNRELGIRVVCSNSHSWELPGKTMVEVITDFPGLAPGYILTKLQDLMLEAVTPG
jgi:hypothetical protein